MIQQYKTWFKDHYNLMTPKLVKVKELNDKYLVELSTSITPFLNLYQYGVTVIESNGETGETFRTAIELDLNRSFSNENRALAKEEALKYFQGLTLEKIKEKETS